jgi:predicted nucleotidyltransferase
MKSVHELKKELELLKPTLKKRFKVETVEIFGSYARGEQTDASDVDLLVTYSQMTSFFTIYDLEKFLQRKLGVRVDVVSKKFLNPHLKDKVLQEAVSV